MLKSGECFYRSSITGSLDSGRSWWKWEACGTEGPQLGLVFVLGVTWPRGHCRRILCGRLLERMKIDQASNLRAAVIVQMRGTLILYEGDCPNLRSWPWTLDSQDLATVGIRQDGKRWNRWCCFQKGARIDIGVGFHFDLLILRYLWDILLVI